MPELPWERWLELAALMRTLWPTAALPDETIREWYERGARRWDFDYTQAAMVMWLEESSHAPSFADIANRRRALLEADQRQRDASRRSAEPQPSEEEWAQLLEARARWSRIWAAMAHRDYGQRVRAEVARLIGSDETGYNGRARRYDETVTRWSQLQPGWGPGEAESILGRLELAVEQARAEAIPGRPRMSVPLAAASDLLAEWAAGGVL